MRTCTTELYKYDELDESAQERARDAARAAGWGDNDIYEAEWRSTLTKAAEEFDLTYVDWSIGLGSHSYARVAVRDDDIAELEGVRAWKYLLRHYAHLVTGDCPLTGVCYDETFLDPLRTFLERPDTTSTVQDIMSACATSWAHGWLAEMEYQVSDEAVSESLIATEHEFTKTGAFH